MSRCPPGYTFVDKVLSGIDGRLTWASTENENICIGPAYASYKLNNRGESVIDTSMPIKCAWGRPMYNGPIDGSGSTSSTFDPNNGLSYKGDVQCVYSSPISNRFGDISVGPSIMSNANNTAAIDDAQNNINAQNMTKAKLGSAIDDAQNNINAQNMTKAKLGSAIDNAQNNINAQKINDTTQTSIPINQKINDTTQTSIPVIVTKR